MILLINFLPFFSFLILNLFGRFLGRRFCLSYSVMSLIVSFVVSSWLFFLVLDGNVIELKLFNWISNGNLIVDFSFIVDSLYVIF